jgi:probable phosphoglycerate mutase
VFLFLRHGRTRGNAQRMFQRPDEPLDDHGVGQAERAAAILSGAAFSHIMASTMARAWQTAGHRGHGDRAPCDRARADPRALFRRLHRQVVGAARLADRPAQRRDSRLLRRAHRGGPRERACDRRHAAVVAHGGTLHCLAGLLRLELAPEILQNAVPLLADARRRRLDDAAGVAVGARPALAAQLRPGASARAANGDRALEALDRRFSRLAGRSAISAATAGSAASASDSTMSPPRLWPWQRARQG